MSETIFLAGLPRSGSTVVCNLLAQHPEIAATPSSPLCAIVQNMRRQWSDDPFLLSQLDDNFDEVYDRLKRSTTAFIDEWSETGKKITIDKNRGWLFCLETIKHLYPEFKLIVCLRDLRAVFASVEKQHRKTLLMEYPDHMEHNLIDVRAEALFNDGGIIGSPLKALYNVGDVPNIANHIFYLRFEDLVADPKSVLLSITQWLGMPQFDFNLENIEQVTHESDSYYRFKFPHKIASKFQAPNTSLENFSPRILNTILTRFAWYYEMFYPQQQPIIENKQTETESRVQDEVAQALDGE